MFAYQSCQAKRKNSHEDWKYPRGAVIAKRKGAKADKLSSTDAKCADKQRRAVHELDFGVTLKNHERDVAAQAADAEIDIAERILLRFPLEEFEGHWSKGSFHRTKNSLFQKIRILSNLSKNITQKDDIIITTNCSVRTLNSPVLDEDLELLMASVSTDSRRGDEGFITSLSDRFL